MLGARKGYSLVACDFLGVNAFFVLDYLLEDKFCAPYTSENHFEPSRLFLYRRNGQLREIGRFVTPAGEAPVTEEETLNPPTDREPPPLKWSTLRYVFGQDGGPRCRARDTRPRRSSPSCAR